MPPIWDLRVKSHTSRQKPYDRENLQRAYQAYLNGTSVYRASRMFGVPESTLRDRTRNNVAVDCSLGAPRLFNEAEERQLVQHIIYMSSIGYGYGSKELQILSADYAKSLDKTNIKTSLSKGWVQSFVKRHSDDLKVVKPQKLSLNRAKSASSETIKKYFNDLHMVLQENKITEKPQNIYNLDESGFSTEHKPPSIVCGKDIKPQSVVSERSKNVTVIGSANAIGNHVAPFYIFPGKRWMDELLVDCAPGSDGDITDSGFVNRGLFESYMTNHFAKHVNLKNDSKTLVLYDGSKAHLSLTLANWAKENNVVLFLLPPHSSHLTQPLDVGIFGPMKRHFYSECKIFMHSNPGRCISRYEIAKLTARPYAKAFSPDNIISSFKKAGIYPFNPEVILEAQTAPAEIYQPEPTPCTLEIENAMLSVNVTSIKTVTPIQPEKTIIEKGNEYLQSKKITTVVKSRPKKKFVPPQKIVGNLLSEKNMEILKENHEKVQNKEKTNQLKSSKSEKDLSHSIVKPSNVNPKPSTSGLNSDKVDQFL